MKQLLPFVFVLLAGPAFSQEADLPENTTDSFAGNDMLLKGLLDQKPHSITTVRKNPEAYRGLPFDTEVWFHETRKSTNPFFTRFTTDNYVCFAAWGEEQPIWHKDEYKNDFPFLFIDRHLPLPMRALLDAKPYQKLRLRATVRDVFRGIPYIEVTKVEDMGELMSDASIVEAARAQQAAAKGDTAMALSGYEKALRSDLPKNVKARMLCDVAMVHFARNDRAAALAQIEQAKKLKPEDAAFKQALEKLVNDPSLRTPKPAENETPSVASRPAGKDTTKTAEASTKGGAK